MLAIAKRKRVEVGEADAGRLQDRAMLVAVTFKSWGGEKEDKEEGKEVIKRNGARDGAAKVKKILLSKDALAEWKGARNAAYSRHTAMTLPWGEDAYRILSAPLFMAYRTEMSEYRAQLDAAADHIEHQYPSYIAEAANILGDLFDAKDYPDPSDIRRRFGVDIRYRTVPSAADFRVDLGEEGLSAVKQAVNLEFRENLHTATSELVGRIRSEVEELRDKMERVDSGEEKRIYDTILSDIRGLVRLVPSMNITGDPRIDQLVADMDNELLKYRVEELRQRPTARADVGDAAQTILDRMEGYGF